MDLKTQQKTVLAVGLFLMALVGLFPPWLSSVDILENNEVRPGYSEPGGRHFLFVPPKPLIGEKSLIVSRSIDYSRLVVEWLVIAFFTASVLGLRQIVAERKVQLRGGDIERPRAA